MPTACTQFIAISLKCTENESYQDEAKYEKKKNKTNDTRPAAICYPIDQSDYNN